jgi:hypothetical protein
MAFFFNNRASRQKDVKVKRVVNNKVKEGDKSKVISSTRVENGLQYNGLATGAKRLTQGSCSS